MADAEEDGTVRRRKDDVPGRRTEDRIEKRRRRDEKRKRKELRRLRRVARASLPNTSRNDDEEEDSEAQREKDLASERKLADSGIFVWKKKNEQLRKRGVRLTVEDELQRKREISEDLEKSKQRRAERDAERAQWENEQAEMTREREQAANADWYRAEDAFMGTQHLLRQAIRLKEGRGTHMDQLARNMRLDVLEIHCDTRSPAEYLEDKVRRRILSATDLDAMLDKIDAELDSLADFTTDVDTAVFNHTSRLAWWNSIAEFLKALVRSVRERTSYVGSSSNVHNSVQEDVDKLLNGKSKVELEILEHDLTDRLANGNGDGAFGEVDFWAAAIRSVRSELARLKLGELNQKFNAERNRSRVLNSSSNSTRRSELKKPSGEADFVKVEESKGMAEGEETFAEEVSIAVEERRVQKEEGKKEYHWNDKYRPRKPRYYNRVHTGYDWTKYNRTHYDQNNPPPKTVQGYKFNIFYPDLMDKSVTPTFKITKTDNPDVAIITFTSGKPYLDIAFKIVNRPWEQSHRKGYRCAFNRGILQLWFTFQRYRYRR